MAWGEVKKFAGVRSIMPPLSESDVLALELRYGCRLPLELRELYREFGCALGLASVCVHASKQTGKRPLCAQG